MRFGIEIPTCRELSPYPLGFATPDAFRDLAVGAERLGYYSLWGNDHLVNTPDEVPDLEHTPAYYEPFVTYAFIAAITSRVKLVTATLVTPLRQPVLVAKQVATLDRLSGGRLLLGVGLGSKRPEFEALASNPKWSRGKMHEEFIEALKVLLDRQQGSFEGRYFRFGEIFMQPAPVQRPFPIYMSGNVPDALDRIGRLASGLIVSATVTNEQLKGRIDFVRAAAARAGRDPAGLDVCLFQNVAIDATEEGAHAAHEALRASRLPREAKAYAPAPDAPPAAAAPGRTGSGLVGTPTQIVDRMREYKAMGVDHVGMVMEGRSVDEVLVRSELFAREVMPRLSE